MTKISQEVAISIFMAKKSRRSKRDNLASTLAARYGITSRSVRGIWNLRTWAHATKPFWTTDDHYIFLLKHRDQLEENRIGQGEEDHQARSEALSRKSLVPFCTFTERGCRLYRASVWNRANNLHNHLLEDALRCFEYDDDDMTASSGVVSAGPSLTLRCSLTWLWRKCMATHTVRITSVTTTRPFSLWLCRHPAASTANLCVSCTSSFSIALALDSLVPKPRPFARAVPAGLPSARADPGTGSQWCHPLTSAHDCFETQPNFCVHADR